MCVMVKRHVCSDWGWGYFHSDLKNLNQTLQCIGPLSQSSHSCSIKIADQFWAGDLFKVSLCQLVLLQWISVATFFLYQSNVLVLILPHIHIFSFLLDLQLFAKSKPPKGLYVFGDVGKFQLLQFHWCFLYNACLFKF